MNRYSHGNRSGALRRVGLNQYNHSTPLCPIQPQHVSIAKGMQHRRSLLNQARLDQDGDEAQLISLIVGCPLPVPLLQHHQDPNHGAVVASMLIQMLPEQVVDEVGTNNISRPEAAQAVRGQKLQTPMLLQPNAERQAESVLLLSDNIVGKKSPQRFFKKIT